MTEQYGPDQMAAEDKTLNERIDAIDADIPLTVDSVDERIDRIEANQNHMIRELRHLVAEQQKIFAQTTWCATQLQMAMEAFKNMPGLGNMLGRRA